MRRRRSNLDTSAVDLLPWHKGVDDPVDLLMWERLADEVWDVKIAAEVYGSEVVWEHIDEEFWR